MKILFCSIFFFIVGSLVGAIALELFWYGPLRKKHSLEFENNSYERWNEVVNSNPDAILPGDFGEQDDPFVQDRLDDQLGPFLPGIEYSEKEKERDIV